MTSGEKWTNVWRGVVICVGTPLLYAGVENQSTVQWSLGWAVLLLAAPLCALGVGCLWFVALALFGRSEAGYVLAAAECGGYAWVGVKMLRVVQKAKQREAREEEVRKAEAAQEQRRLEAKKRVQARVRTDSREILQSISGLLSSCGKPATEIMRTSSALNGTNVAEPKRLILHDVAAILLGFLSTESAGDKYIERLWRGIAGRYLRGMEKNNLWSIRDFANSGDKPTTLVGILTTYDQLQGTQLASMAASKYLDIVGDVASHCGDSLAARLVSIAYVEILRPYVRSTEAGDHDGYSGASRKSGFNAAGCEQCAQGYQLLGLPEGATEDELKRKRRAWVEILHPDQLGSKSEKARHAGEEQLKSINVAYDHIVQCRFSSESA